MQPDAVSLEQEALQRGRRLADNICKTGWNINT